MIIDQIYEPFFRHFRGRRMRQFINYFNINNSTNILDVGGTQFNWSLVPAAPQITLLNVDIAQNHQIGRFRWIRGDARALPFRDNQFDVSYSNSVIEHVGGWAEQQQFARELRRTAPSYYVQTPNKWFFIEPHVIGAFIHWLPIKLYVPMARFLSVRGWLIRDSAADREAFIRSIHLLTESEMRQLFPDATIARERFFFMTKSIIAFRREMCKGDSDQMHDGLRLDQPCGEAA